MEKYSVLILGGGYGGINAYYGIRDKRHVAIIDSKRDSVYHGKSRDIRMKVPAPIIENIKKVDIEEPYVQTDRHEYYPEKLVISTGCNRESQIEFMSKSHLYNNMYLGSKNEYDDYILIQYILKLNKAGIRAGYSGNFLSFLGKEVETKVRKFLEISGVPLSPEPDFLLPECSPNIFENYINVDKNLMVNENTYAIGDVLDWSAKCGELSMRQGAFAGRHMSGKVHDFKPVFITILDNLKGTGIRIKSTEPWNSGIASAHIGGEYSLMAGFLMRYYGFRNGNMGILQYF
ncbi:hypothetical protein [Ferroplasma acidarmanus]|uniref:FAD/NAD(P)-binding domain-containing protein n=1 Tax=Ferroplasma acidarmanus Fer1 TaxID=333146 RepID=S0APL3_FERAC|nr:hypothetical protein [Ferroplasma acidarmanus]AGO60821.1 hypothetical protein FACI_IFERC00001G0841 [Ferroplasma acidarmanus Fer1]